MSDMYITITKTEKVTATVEPKDLIACVSNEFKRRLGVSLNSYVDKYGKIITRSGDSWISNDEEIPNPSMDQLSAVETLTNLRRLLGA